MAAYMKTDMPFHGVASKKRKVILRQLVGEYPVADRVTYEGNVRSLWNGTHREEKYVAIAYARAFSSYITLTSIPLYRTMIKDGAWWDFVDEIAAHLIGTVLLNQRAKATRHVAAWVTDSDLWLRRTSIIGQRRHKNETDTDLLEYACTTNLSDGDFFIRKAIGWALREYGKSDAEWVTAYVAEHRPSMAGLTFREATKHLDIER